MEKADERWPMVLLENLFLGNGRVDQSDHQHHQHLHLHNGTLDRFWDMPGPIHGPRVSSMERLAAMVNQAKRLTVIHVDTLMDLLFDLSNGIPFLRLRFQLPWVKC